MTSCPVEQRGHRKLCGQQKTFYIWGSDRLSLQFDLIYLLGTVRWEFLGADIVYTWNRSEGGKTLHDTVFWQEETTGLKPGVTSQHTNWYSVVAVFDLNLWMHNDFQARWWFVLLMVCASLHIQFVHEQAEHTLTLGAMYNITNKCIPSYLLSEVPPFPHSVLQCPLLCSGHTAKPGPPLPQWRHRVAGDSFAGLRDDLFQLCCILFQSI